jgi:hypothetical protein
MATDRTGSDHIDYLGAAGDGLSLRAGGCDREAAWPAWKTWQFRSLKLAEGRFPPSSARAFQASASHARDRGWRILPRGRHYQLFRKMVEVGSDRALRLGLGPRLRLGIASALGQRRRDTERDNDGA